MFARMHSYTVYSNGPVTDPEHLVCVREGISVWAFLLGPVWALYHRLWLTGAGLVTVQVLVFQLTEAGGMSAAGSQALSVLLSAGLALFGHDLVRARLERKGYACVDVVIADTQARALLRFLDHIYPSSSGLLTPRI